MLSLALSPYRLLLRSLAVCNKTLAAYAVVLGIALPLVGCGNDTPEKPAVSRSVRYVTVPSPSLDTPAFIRVGDIRAHDDIALSFRLDGRIISRAVDVGDRVHNGQVLATLESDTSRNQLNSARADVESAKAAEHIATLNLNRMKQLIAAGAIAQLKLDEAQAEWQAAVSRRKSSEAALKTANDNLGWTRIVAPQDGIIISTSAASGQVVSAGQTVLALAVSNRRDAVFDVADPHFISQHAGQPFTVSLLSHPSIRAAGTLRDISPQADPLTRTWRIRIALDSPPDAMALGANIQGEMPSVSADMTELPASALTRIENTPAVYVVNDHMQLELRPITVGRYSTHAIFVSAGLRVGEKVVTAGISTLREGEQVALEGEGQ